MGWNTVKVKADGKILRYYINNTMLWSGVDPSLKKGQVGIMAGWGPGCANGRFLVDWARVTPLN